MYRRRSQLPNSCFKTFAEICKIHAKAPATSLVSCDVLKLTDAFVSGVGLFDLANLDCQMEITRWKKFPFRSSCEGRYAKDIGLLQAARGLQLWQIDVPGKDVPPRIFVTCSEIFIEVS